MVLTQATLERSRICNTKVKQTSHSNVLQLIMPFSLEIWIKNSDIAIPIVELDN